MSESRIHSAMSAAAVWLICISANACVLPSSNVRVTLHPRSTIVSGAGLESSFQLFYHCGAPPSQAPSGVWSPRSVEVVAVDRQVRIALASALLTDQVADADDYYIQYFGLVMDGRQVIFANGVHEVAARGYLPDRWHSAPMVICDLGRAGFRTEYDTGRRQLAELRFAEEYPPTR